MANIQKRPNGKWRARYRDEAGKEHARHFERKVDAQRWLDEVTASVITGQYVDPRAGKITFDAWWKQWSERQVWTTGTRESADQAAACVTFGSVPMKALKPSHFQQWLKSMSQPGAKRSGGLAPSTIRTRWNYVHMAVVGALRDRIIATDPTLGVTLPRVRRSEAAMTIPSAAQVRAALDASPEHFRAFIALAAFAGLRLGEASGFQIRDIDFLRRTVSVQRQVQGQTRAGIEIVPPKYGSERTIAVPEALIDFLSWHVREVGVHGPERWLFASGSDRLNRNSAGNLWRATRKAADLPEQYTLHDLRHFYASALIASGCDVVTVQRALGHQSAQITLGVYAHLWPTAEDRTRSAAADLMHEVLGSPADSVRTGTP